MARVLLITNPVAARSDPAVVREVSTVLAREGWDVDVVGTTRPGHAGELAHEGVESGVDVVAVYGGDGTTMQAVRGLMGCDVPLGLIPGGTGNLLARNLRLPQDPAEAARTIVRGKARRIDVGRMPRPEGERYFAVCGGAGFDAEVMAGTTIEAKRRWKMGAYVVQAWNRFAELQNVIHKVTVDGELIEAEAATVLLVNCPEIIPPFFPLRAGIAPDDGVLDVVLLKARGLLEGAGVMWQLLRGTGADQENIRWSRGRHVTVETAVERPVQLDGDEAGVTPCSAELLPGALTILVSSKG